jgi:hypothetical protein
MSKIAVDIFRILNYILSNLELARMIAIRTKKISDSFERSKILSF